MFNLMLIIVLLYDKIKNTIVILIVKNKKFIDI